MSIDPIRVEKVTLSWGRRRALNAVSFTATGGVVALVGPNGAGKTTLLRILSGDLDPDSGHAAVGDATSRRARRGAAGYLPQFPQLHPRMTSSEFVAYCAWLRNLASKEAREASVGALESVGLSERAGDRVSELSGGMQRRLAIAAVVASSPRVLLLDEPMSGLDPEQRLEIRSVIKKLSSDALVLLATHVMQDLPELVDQVVMLNEGEVCFDGDLRGFLGGSSDHSTEELERAFVRHLRRNES